MVDLIEQNEATPANYPAVPTDLSEAAAALDAGAIWARIEAYTAHRFTDRQVVWVIEGQAGEAWKPPLTPVTSRTAERWEDSAWTSVTILDGPVGLCLPSNGTFRITAQVGSGAVPAPVSQAFKRLIEYSVDLGKDSMVSGHPAHTDHSTEIGGSIKESFSRSPTWAARAIQLSGAADLLRPYRRA